MTDLHTPSWAPKRAPTSEEQIVDLLRRLQETLGDVAGLAQRMGAIEDVMRQLLAIAAKEPAADPAAGQIAQALAAVHRALAEGMQVVVPEPPPPVDLTPLIEVIRESALDNEELLSRLKEIQPKVIGGSQTRQVKLLGSSGGVVDPATESTLGLVKDRADLLATQATLATMLTEATFAAEDFATQTTLAALKSRVDLLLSETAFDAVDFATQTTLAAVNTRVADLLDETTFGAVDFATQTTLAAILAEMTRANKVTQATAGTGTGFTTIVELTPGADITVTGFNADVTSITDIRYRMQLVTGAAGSETVIVTEQLTSGMNSWIPVSFDVASGTRVAVMVEEGEIGSVSCRASIAYRE